MNLKLHTENNHLLENRVSKKQKFRTNILIPVLLALIVFFTGLPCFLYAQLNFPYWADITTPGVTDLIVPSDAVNLYVSIGGAQGGSVTSTCTYYGGKGFYWSGVQFPVSYCSPTRIAPGGTLRLIVGGQGLGVRNATNVGGGGGGGGSALLYKAPGSSTWVILVVAGGGGGAAFNYGELSAQCQGDNGLDATELPGGGNGTNDGGSGGTNGNGGTGVGVYSFGGGGAFSDGVTTASQSCNGKKGFPDGGAQGNCNDLFTYYGGFGFGSGGAGIAGGGGGGGYSGGGAGQSNALHISGGGGGGGSYLNTDWDNVYAGAVANKVGDGEIKITLIHGTLTPPLSLESSTLPARQVLGCSLLNCADFGYSINETATTLDAFTAAGGKIVSGGCGVQSVTYHDSAANQNPIKTVYRTFTVTDVGNNKAIAKQTINITNPGIAATLTPSSQVVCGNVKPATITANVTTQFGLTVQWYQGDDAIFSNSTIIQGAISVSYSPPATSIAGVTYYFIKMTDGCGTITVKNATVNVGQVVTWYKDLDNDGYYDSSYHGLPTCTKPGQGYKFEGLLGIDCNDNDSTINPQTVWVLDADGDGYYPGSPYAGCVPNGATGYVKKTTQLPGDCNDNDASINPAATEVFNGKDDNCDGKIDEGLCGTVANLTAINITENSATVSWDSGLNASKYNLSYKAAGAATWTVVKNLNATSYNFKSLPLYSTYDYKVQSTCPYTEKSAYSKVSSFTTNYGGPVYCATNGNTRYEYINKVVLGAINNTSGDNNGYGDYTNLSTTLTAGTPVQIKLTPGFYSSADTEYWEVYIDYNHDGLFKNSDGERVVAGRKFGTLSKSFTVPLTAKDGFTRMRIMVHFNNVLNQPCDSFINGEAEDYTVIITGGVPGPAYCATQGETSYEAIDKVSLGSIDNTSGNNSGYGDYTSLNTSLAAGSSAKIKLTPVFYAGAYTEYWEVYIDYNQDGLFSAADGEKVTTGYDTGAIVNNFTVPLNAKNGNTRMRVMMHYSSFLDQPCGNFLDGEAEDYTVNITGGSTALIAKISGEQEAIQATAISSILVIPNPVNTSVATAVLNITKDGNASLIITDISGRGLYKKDVTNLRTGKNSINLDGLATLANGTYFIQAIQNGAIIGRTLVIVNK